jgi:hypothetical protein
MDTIPSSSKPRRERLVSPEEGQLLVVRELLATLEAAGDVAAEKTWQAHALVLLQHGQGFLQELGMVPVLKMQQMCAEMVIKIRLANRKGDGNNEDVLAEYQQMLEEIFTRTPEDVPLAGEDAAEEDDSV